MSAYDNHADAIAYRYGGDRVGAQLLAHMSTADLVARIDAAEAVESWRTDWATYRVLADRSGIAHEFEAGYSRDLEERYNAVRALVPDADPNVWRGELDAAYDAAYDAYADTHPDTPVPTARALAWAREQIKEMDA